ncbi:hypothetical protein QF035_011204 [Streptomyces umbrinus]|uniref:Uncharacterized protein n=1 Tax=Streptomyces umbrinus TaxID=67370 RepID=A0ABU0TCJ4_9ACTN|nr:hypothetical protein [Streptomyces umbrinus]MDQ1033535.1 hypothetical protein [Streptomyces umbrinus]
MTDHTPHEGGYDNQERLLDQLLADHHDQLLHTVADALDARAGLAALKPLRHAQGPGLDVVVPVHESPEVAAWREAVDAQRLQMPRRPGSLAAVLQQFEQLTDLLACIRRAVPRATMVNVAALASSLVLVRLERGLAGRTLTRAGAHQLLAELEEWLGESVQAMAGAPSGPGHLARLVCAVESLPALHTLVMNLFEDAQAEVPPRHGQPACGPARAGRGDASEVGSRRRTGFCGALLMLVGVVAVFAVWAPEPLNGLAFLMTVPLAALGSRCLLLGGAVVDLETPSHVVPGGYGAAVSQPIPASCTGSSR